ncbi:hypothetical protein OXX59_003095 [Metschnikowia pulcherrima]
MKCFPRTGYIVLQFLLYAFSVQCLGNLYVSINGSPKRYDIAFGSTNAYLYDSDGSIQSLENSGYLVFLGNGKLTLSTRPGYGFEMVLSTDCSKGYKVSYQGASSFYLCENRDISISNACPGAQEASIIFDGSV